jgi:hypothetical protein
MYETVTFTTPFSLPGVEGIIPPGTYEVATEEELLEQLSFRAYHRLGTSIRIPVPGGGPASYQVISIEPRDLEAAQERGAGPSSAGSKAG